MTKTFWTTIRHLRGYLGLSGDSVLLTSTKDVVDGWREYFKDLLSLTDTPFGEEVGPGDPVIGSYLQC